mgnify:CR=1 FL=1
MSLKRETPDCSQTETNPTPDNSIEDHSNDAKVRQLTILHSYFFIYFISLLFAFIVISCCLKTPFFTVGWPNKNMGNPWQMRDYLDYSSQYAGLVGAILAAIGITANNSSYYSELLTKFLSRQLASIVLATLQLANFCITSSIFMLIYEAEKMDVLPLIIGLGFNVISIISPMMFMFLAQRLVRRNIKKRMEIVRSEIIKLEKAFPELKGVIKASDSQPNGVRNGVRHNGNVRKIMARIQRKSEFDSLPYWMAIITLFTTIIGSAIFISQLPYEHNYLHKHIVVGVTSEFFTTLSISLPFIFFFGITRVIWAEFLLQKLQRWCLTSGFFILSIYIEALILIDVWAGITTSTSSLREIVLTIAFLCIFVPSFLMSVLSVCCKRKILEGSLYPMRQFAQQLHIRLNSEEKALAQALEHSETGGLTTSPATLTTR